MRLTGRHRSARGGSFPCACMFVRLLLAVRLTLHHVDITLFSSGTQQGSGWAGSKPAAGPSGVAAPAARSDAPS